MYCHSIYIYIVHVHRVNANSDACVIAPTCSLYVIQSLQGLACSVGSNSIYLYSYFLIIMGCVDLMIVYSYYIVIMA